MRKWILALCSAGLLMTANAQKDKKAEKMSAEEMAEIEAQLQYMDSLNNAIKYETGKVTLKGGYAQLNIGNNFKFVNDKQAQYILSDLWGNPKRPDVLGLLVPKDWTPFVDSSFAFVLSFDEEGYVKDDDADEINYDDMAADFKKTEPDENKERKKQGYSGIHFNGWASKPFYDKDKKVLHWAKNLKFEDADGNTLNYDVRVLGRKGVLSLNAVAGMEQLNLVKANIDEVLQTATFTEGNAYKDFNSSTDKIAAIGIGGLVAGKVLAKAGAFAFLAKFAKVIFLGVAGLVGLVWRKITGRRKEEPTA
jgi:uncharacterized membrane-anchored protein